MIDIELIRQKPELVKESERKRGKDEAIVDTLSDVDERWRTALKVQEEAEAAQNQLSRQIIGAPTSQQLEKAKKVKEAIHQATEEQAKLFTERRELWLGVSNILASEVPVGAGESANTVTKTVGHPELSNGQAHEELMIKLDWLDLESAASIAGARFRFLKRDAAVAHMLLMQEAFQFAVKKGFIPVIPPVILRGETLERGGFFPQGREDTFALGDEEFLVGTSEYSLVGQLIGRTIDAKDLPLRFVGFSTCFRQEAGAYGKDTKGMFRQHQFDKVEMVSVVAPEESASEHKYLLQMQEEFIGQFNLPYQVVLIGSGDVEAKAVKRFDIETWFPGQSRYRETHSASNCTDFQSRRSDIKIRQETGKPVLAHTLNGTLATERLLLAIIENNQKPDGTVELPKSLHLKV